MKITLRSPAIKLCVLLLVPCLAFTQSRRQQVTSSPQPSSSSPMPAASASAPAVNRDYVRENYTKLEYRIPVRDGVKLFTSVYIPNDVFTDGTKYPMLMQRTGYNVAPYGLEEYRANLGPSELFAREKFIFVYQDIRGRFMSEGEYVLIRPVIPPPRLHPRGA